MKKEEILERSRKENNKKDLVKIEAENKAVKIAALSVLILTTIYYILEIVIDGKTNNGWYSIIALYCAVVYGYIGIKTKNKLNIITSIIWGLVTIILTISYIHTILLGAI